MQRAAAPPHPPRPAVRADNLRAPGRAANEYAPAAGTFTNSSVLKTLSMENWMQIKNYIFTCSF
jgi:hypothetical protein